MGFDVRAFGGARAVFGVGLLALLAAQPAAGEIAERIMRVAGTSVHYKLVLPDGYDAARAYPAVLVMGGGPQTMDTVERTLDRNFRAEAEKRGYIVVAPAAPDGRLFFQGGERIFPEFLDAILANYQVTGRKFHVAGPSNGGIAAMHVAAKHPSYFVSATAFPGYLWQPTNAKLEAMADLCVFLYVGEHDEYRWHDEMQREAQFLSARGTLARYVLERGEGHRLESLTGTGAARLFDGFEEATRGCKR
jgi:poly(3-hydroxybutyrate) depolymerase